METKINLTPVVYAILEVFLKPYNELLSKMAIDGRLTQEELTLLRQQVTECGESLGATLRSRMAR